MSFVKLGNTDLKLTELIFGAWAIGGWLWGGNDENESRRAIEAAIDLGITSIDTAPAYGHGLSESLVGDVIQGKRDRVQILTKYGLVWDTDKGKPFFKSQKNDGTPVHMHTYSGKDGIIRECEDSLRRLKTDYIDLYQMHWPDPTTPVEESMEAVDSLMKQGKVRAAGICNNSIEGMQRAASVLSLASNQVAYSMVKRDIEKEIVPHCIDNNIGILVYSPLQRGILAGKITTDASFNSGDNRPDTPYYIKENIVLINEFLENIRPLADARGVSMAQLVLRWTLQQPGITCILAGARNESQITENAGILEFRLTKEETDTIEQQLGKLELNLAV